MVTSHETSISNIERALLAHTPHTELVTDPSQTAIQLQVCLQNLGNAVQSAESPGGISLNRTPIHNHHP
jgi:hypothetical protein